MQLQPAACADIDADWIGFGKYVYRGMVVNVEKWFHIKNCMDLSTSRHARMNIECASASVWEAKSSVQALEK